MTTIELSVQSDEERARLDQLAKEKGVINAGTTRIGPYPIELEFPADAADYPCFSISRVEHFNLVDPPKKPGVLRRLLHRQG